MLRSRTLIVLMILSGYFLMIFLNQYISAGGKNESDVEEAVGSIIFVVQSTDKVSLSGSGPISEVLVLRFSNHGVYWFLSNNNYYGSGTVCQNSEFSAKDLNELEDKLFAVTDSIDAIANLKFQKPNYEVFNKATPDSETAVYGRSHHVVLRTWADCSKTFLLPKIRGVLEAVEIDLGVKSRGSKIFEDLFHMVNGYNFAIREVNIVNPLERANRAP